MVMVKSIISKAVKLVIEWLANIKKNFNIKCLFEVILATIFNYWEYELFRTKIKIDLCSVLDWKLVLIYFILD